MEDEDEFEHLLEIYNKIPSDGADHSSKGTDRLL